MLIKHKVKPSALLVSRPSVECLFYLYYMSNKLFLETFKWSKAQYMKHSNINLCNNLTSVI